MDNLELNNMWGGNYYPQTVKQNNLYIIIITKHKGLQVLWVFNCIDNYPSTCNSDDTASSKIQQDTYIFAPSVTVIVWAGLIIGVCGIT